MQQTKRQLFWEAFRFLLVGLVATLVDYTVFWFFDGVLFSLLHAQGGWETACLVLSTALGFCVGLLVNWTLSVRFVFRAVKNEQEVRSKKSFFLFAGIGIIGLIFTEVGVVALVAVLPEIKLFGSVSLLNTDWEKWLAKGVMTVLVLVWNYVGRKLLIFRP